MSVMSSRFGDYAALLRHSFAMVHVAHAKTHSCYIYVFHYGRRASVIIRGWGMSLLCGLDRVAEVSAGTATWIEITQPNQNECPHSVHNAYIMEGTL